MSAGTVGTVAQAAAAVKRGVRLSDEELALYDERGYLIRDLAYIKQ